MRRSLLVVLVLASLPSIAAAQDTTPSGGVEARADELEGRLRELREGTWDLDARIGDSYRRLAAIELAMRGDAGGARVAITQENHVGPFYRLVEASYAIDGVSVYHQSDASGALGRAPIEVHTGAVAPGTHTLTVVLRYEGEGGALFRYVEGYRFRVRSSHTFTVPEGDAMELRVDAYEHAERPYTERLDVVYVERLEALR